MCAYEVKVHCARVHFGPKLHLTIEG